MIQKLPTYLFSIPVYPWYLPERAYVVRNYLSKKLKLLGSLDLLGGKKTEVK